jgi:tetratricopeptide (TPR) repeat protein
MTVDLYATCPCGNGKKIKFCKCKESVGQMDRVLKMIEGGQIVPAMDRLRSILEEHPDAAWALAIRGRLLLDLREYDSLAENADRFIRLQPANPLALTQRAAALVFKQDMQGATEALLEALNESGQEVDAFLMDVALIVAMGLAQQGVVLSSRVYALLAINSQGYDDDDRADNFLAQLDRSSSLNHYLKSLPQLIRRPSDVDWGERYDEAVALLHSNKVLLAQDKFESLRRSAPMQPAVYSGLFHCAVWRGELERQSEMAGHLSEIESLDLESRQTYAAIAALLRPQDSIAVPTQTIHIETEDIEQAELALISSDRTDQLPPEQLERAQMPGSEIRPRSAFLLADRPLVDGGDGLPEPADGPATLALVSVFGKQTDRSAEVVAYDITTDRSETVRELLVSIVNDGQVRLDDPEPVPLTFAAEERPIFHAKPKTIGELVEFNRVFSMQRLPQRVCALPLPILGNKSLAEVADDDALAFQRAVVVRILEGYELFLGAEGVLDKIYEISKIDPLPPIKPTEQTLGDVAVADFHRVDPSELSPIGLYVLASNSQSTGNRTACKKLAETLVNKTADAANEQADVRMTMEAYLLWMMNTVHPVESIEISDKAIAFAKKHNLNYSSVLLARMELYLSMADQDGFRESIMAIEKDYGNDPAVMARVQQTLVQMGLLRPDGSVRQPGGPAPGTAAPATELTPAAPPEQRSEGLWTPDSPNPPNPAGGEGGGKIWVPGMD